MALITGWNLVADDMKRYCTRTRKNYMRYTIARSTHKMGRLKEMTSGPQAILQINVLTEELRQAQAYLDSVTVAKAVVLITAAVTELKRMGALEPKTTAVGTDTLKLSCRFGKTVGTVIVSSYVNALVVAVWKTEEAEQPHTILKVTPRGVTRHKSLPRMF